MQIIDFTEEWILAASRLAMENYLEEQSAVDCLPEAPGLPALDGLARNGLGVAAVEEGKLLGFLGAYGPWTPVFYTQNVCGVFSPIHAHGAKKENRVKIYRRMYQTAAEKWVNAGAASHAIALYAHDLSAHEAFFTYGFGMRCMDLIRQTTLPDCPGVSDCRCLELPAARHGELRHLRKSLADHLAQSPGFMRDEPRELEAWLKRRENDPPRVFAAEQDGHIVAYMEVTEEGENFAVSVPGTRNICGAFCLPEYRGRKIAQGLLRYILSVLQAEGYTCLGVDCESFNPTALNFWTKYFSVYTHSVVRRIDENAIVRP